MIYPYYIDSLNKLAADGAAAAAAGKVARNIHHTKELAKRKASAAADHPRSVGMKPTATSNVAPHPSDEARYAGAAASAKAHELANARKAVPKPALSEEASDSLQHLLPGLGIAGAGTAAALGLRKLLKDRKAAKGNATKPDKDKKK